MPELSDRRHTNDLQALRTQLAGTHGQAYWRSLEELAQTPAFRAFLNKEFPQGADMPPAMSRRRFLTLLGASLALAGLTSCTTQPLERIVPYVKQPEEIVPGKPLYFASAHVLGGFANGILVESNMGRPTKIEGNPDHPASGGKTDALMQAAVLTLYDPDRAQVVKSGGRIRTWDEFQTVLAEALAAQADTGGAGLRILTETVTSPTLQAQLEQILTQYPQATWHQYEPVNRDNVYAGMALAFGEPIEPRYRFDRADVILALDADFLGVGPGRLRYTRDFTDRRRVRADQTAMNRLYAVEGTPSLTGAAADHRWALSPELVDAFGRAVAIALGLDVAPGPDLPEGFAPRVAALARDLQAHQGTSLVLAGEGQPPGVHALAALINETLGNAGQTVEYTDPVVADPSSQIESLRALVGAMADGAVDVLLVLGGNPVYDAPADLDFGGALDRVGLKVHLGLYEDETAVRCDWQLPVTHFLEAWSDARAYDGTASIIQPLIEPLYNGRSAHALLAMITGDSSDPYDIVRATWQPQMGDDFETLWRRSLFAGVIEGTALPAREMHPVEFNLPDPVTPSGQPVLVLRPDPSLYDGRFANNGWLQELPRPFTKLAWDNAALLSPATAAQYGLQNGAMVLLSRANQALEVPVWILPGQADDCVTLHLGQGRTHVGQVGEGAGFNTYTLRTADAPWFAGDLGLEPTGATYPLVTTQTHHSMEGRDLIREASLAEFIDDPEFAHAGEVSEELPSLYPGFAYEGHAWGMSIDMTACIGCNACMVACQAENNIPIVGKDQVANGREMHWIRIDSYYGSDPADPSLLHQPVTCMHCENAPCELVCPVGATVHSHEGLNQMIYNRCVGTRYCSNNCPYKVRRFNFLDYHEGEGPVTDLLHNPEVTVRARGVMEKCTYCVQRINRARIEADDAGRDLQDGDIVTACQAACPADAIVFGDINDAGSRVSQLKGQPHDYGLLTELNTRPRTTYLAKVRNPNPELTDGD